MEIGRSDEKWNEREENRNNPFTKHAETCLEQFYYWLYFAWQADWLGSRNFLFPALFVDEKILMAYKRNDKIMWNMVKARR